MLTYRTAGESHGKAVLAFIEGLPAGMRADLKLIDAERVYGEVLRAALDLRLEAIASAIEARIALGEEPLP